ncbi:MAG: hypothetical protein KTR30_00730 [Saprospiraceae bacterium]|nr:hypothetical protein [Saprospiraceae bacterium]
MKDQFQNLNLMFAALSLGQVLFLLIILYVVWGETNTGSTLPIDKQTLLIIGALGFLGIAYAARGLGNYFRNKAVKEKQPLEQKVSAYRSSLIMRWALVEGFNLFILIMAFLQQDKSMLLLFGAGLIVFFSLKPSTTAFAEAYELSLQEENEIF